jgi:hypothetical protein
MAGQTAGEGSASGGRAAPTPSVFLSYARADDSDGFVKSVYSGAKEPKQPDVWKPSRSGCTNLYRARPDLSELISPSDAEGGSSF